MNSTYKMFVVNEKIILYILFLIVLQFFYIFPTSLYTEFNGFVSPCDGWQGSYFRLYTLLCGGSCYQLAYGRLLVMWLGVKLSYRNFFGSHRYIQFFKMYGTYEIVKGNILSPCKVPTEYMHGILWPYDLQAFILCGPDIVSCVIFIAVFIACSSVATGCQPSQLQPHLLRSASSRCVLWEYVQGTYLFPPAVALGR